MISREATIKYKGYDPDELSPGSHKRICCSCDECGRVRWVVKQQYRNICQSCSNKNRVYKKSFEKTRRKMSDSRLGKSIHSKEYLLKLSKRMSGENHPLYGKFGKNHPKWNPNITNEERLNNRKYPEYHEWRNEVYKRDNFTCQVCNDSQGGNLNAHHLEGYVNNKDLRTTLSNGITLCEKCHKDFHHYYGYGNNSRKQFIEFKNNAGD